MSNDLQNKLFHFEADPPPEVWNKIADALDAGEQTFSHRLYNYEEQPSPEIWNNIESSLEETKAPVIKVIPITRYKKQIRFVAAAASIIAAIFLATIISNQKTGAGSVINGTERSLTTNQSSIIPLNAPGNNTNPSLPDANPSGVEKQETVSRPTNIKRTTSPLRPQIVVHALSFTQKFIPPKADKDELFDVSALNNYMVYSDGEGNAIKLSKKLFSLVHCEDGDGSCKERIHQLQQKLAAGATTTDFGGILEILRQLQ